MTKTNVLGYVAAFPIPEVLQGINAFARGCAQGQWFNGIPGPEVTRCRIQVRGAHVQNRRGILERSSFIAQNRPFDCACA